jgi:ABC-type spermidine/putrescine transport system permease subunit II
VTLGIQVFFIRYGLADTRRASCSRTCCAAVPYVALVMSSVYANLDLRLEEQARDARRRARCRSSCG